jgi:hypothetical protein
MIRNIAIAAALTAAFTCAPLIAWADIAPGTILTGTIDQDLGTASTQVGDKFSISGVHSQSNDVQNAKIYGHIATLTRPGQGRSGNIGLDFDEVRLPSGDVYSLAGSGTVSAQVNTKSNTLKEVGGAAGGAIVGNLLGRLTHLPIGTLVGATGGYLYAKNNRANVGIPKNSTVVVNVNRSLQREQAH